MIALTEAATRRIRMMAEKHQLKEPAVRVKVVGGGCSGLTYDIDFDENTLDNDHIIELDGVRVLVDPESLPYLEGTQIDFVESLLKSGFEFNNPSAQGGCGCGRSFSVG